MIGVETVMNIPEMLGAFLSSHGDHEAAARAFASTDRQEWEELGAWAIFTAPNFNVTHVTHIIKLAMDEPANGGAGVAQDYRIVGLPRDSDTPRFWKAETMRGGTPASPHLSTMQAAIAYVVRHHVVRYIQHPEGK